MNFLRNLQVTRLNDDTVAIEQSNRTTDIHYEIQPTDEGTVVMVNMTEFRRFCDTDDVSLSPTERDNLLMHVEEVARG